MTITEYDQLNYAYWINKNLTAQEYIALLCEFDPRKIDREGKPNPRFFSPDSSPYSILRGMGGYSLPIRRFYELFREFPTEYIDSERRNIFEWVEITLKTKCFSVSLIPSELLGNIKTELEWILKNQDTELNLKNYPLLLKLLELSVSNALQSLDYETIQQRKIRVRNRAKEILGNLFQQNKPLLTLQMMAEIINKEDTPFYMTKLQPSLRTYQKDLDGYKKLREKIMSAEKS